MIGNRYIPNKSKVIHIRNMVCIRCVIMVQDELEKLGINYYSVDIGEVVLFNDTTENQIKTLDISLKKIGLELIFDKNAILVEKIKLLIINLIYYKEDQIKVNLSDYISTEIGEEYRMLSNLFTKVKGMTIEKFYLYHKIEKAKELLIYNELTLTEIARRLHYKNVSHISAQFKNITGITATKFKEIKNDRNDISLLY